MRRSRTRGLALTISAGNGSWRTRHLRLKAAWLQEKLGSGEVDGYHVPGLIQPANLLTKALAGQRIRDLLQLWGMVGQGIPLAHAVIKSKGAVSERMLVAMICCLMVTTATGQPEREVRISIDWDMAGICMLLLMVLGALVIREGIKWGCVQIYHEYLPGSTQRRLRRLQKIRDATSLAIQRELERIGESGGEIQRTTAALGSERQPTTTSSRMRRRSRSPTVDGVRTVTQASTTGSRPTEAHTPPPTRRSQPWEFSGIAESSGIDFSPQTEGQFEDDRVCRDVLHLLTVEHLREGLRQEGLVITGVKDDLTRRLADRLVSQVGISPGPTLRQLKYVLWLWRHGNVSGRYQLRWSDVNNRSRVSNFIHTWKDR